MSRLRTLPTLALVALTAACSRTPASDDRASADLERDLAAARTSAVQLAPRAGGMQVVSAIERIPATPAPSPSAKVARKAPRPVTPPQPVLEETTADESTVGDKVVTVAAPIDSAPILSPRPTRLPAPTPTRREPYWSTADVIRNAPFPVNPHGASHE